MSSTLVRLSSAVLAGLKQSRHISRARFSGFVSTQSGSEEAAAFPFPFPGPFHSTSIDMSNERTPSPTEIEDGLREWETAVSTEQLTAMEKRIHDSHMQAVLDHQEIYHDPVTGFQVYTSYGHLKRGSCCGNACRHCPYEHQNVAPRYKSIKRNNGAFYC